MAWNSKLLKTITTWFGCTDDAKGNTKYTFAKLGFHYQVKKAHLGFEGTLDSVDKNTRIVLSYTVHDGIFVNIKTLNPWQVLFEYADGGYFSTVSHSNELDRIIEALKNLQSQNYQLSYHEIYSQIERIILTYILECASCVNK